MYFICITINDRCIHRRMQHEIEVLDLATTSVRQTILIYNTDYHRPLSRECLETSLPPSYPPGKHEEVKHDEEQRQRARRRGEKLRGATNVRRKKRNGGCQSTTSKKKDEEEQDKHVEEQTN